MPSGESYFRDGNMNGEKLFPVRRFGGLLGEKEACSFSFFVRLVMDKLGLFN